MGVRALWWRFTLLESGLWTATNHTHPLLSHVQLLFDKLRATILTLNEDEIIETPNKLYISYRHGKNFCEVQLMSKAIKIHLDIHISDLEDEQQIARNVSSIGHWGTGATEVKLSSIDEAASSAYSSSVMVPKLFFVISTDIRACMSGGHLLACRYP